MLTVSRTRFSLKLLRSDSSLWMWQSWLRGLGRLIQRQDVENWDSHHSLQPRILHLAFPHHLVSQHDLPHQHGLAVHPEKNTLVHFARDVCSLIHRVHSDVNLMVGATVQNCHKIEQH